VPPVSWPSIKGLFSTQRPVFSFPYRTHSAMSSEPIRVNYPALFIGALGLGAAVLGMVVLLFTQRFAIGFPIIFLGTTVFVTTMLMCAKTTGGPQD
jgi:hypothetical protein